MLTHLFEEVRLAQGTTVLLGGEERALALVPRPHRVHGCLRKRTGTARVQVGDPLEHRKLRARLLERHAPDSARTRSNVPDHAGRDRGSPGVHPAV